MSRQQHGWDCGYANTLALLQTLARRGHASASEAVAARVAPRGDLPTTIHAIQRTVEMAWRAGFDQRSARQYRWRLVGREGKAGWIGAAESFTLLSYLRVDAFIVEVVDRSGAGHAVYEAAAAWFAQEDADAPPDGAPATSPSATSGRRLARSPRLPLYLQGQGHSTTLVGVLRSPPRLLIRDPKDAPLERLRCFPPANLDGRQWQIVGVSSDGALREEQVLARCGDDLQAAARWEHGRWRYEEWFWLRFR